MQRIEHPLFLAEPLLYLGLISMLIDEPSLPARMNVAERPKSGDRRQIVRR